MAVAKISIMQNGRRWEDFILAGTLFLGWRYGSERSHRVWQDLKWGEISKIIRGRGWRLQPSYPGQSAPGC